MAKRVTCKMSGCNTQTSNTKYGICSNCHCGEKSGRGICRKAPSKCRHNKSKRSGGGNKATSKKRFSKPIEKYGGKKGGKRTGVVYGVANPAFPGWVKLGYQKETGKKIIQRYNMYCPKRNFKMVDQEWVYSKIKAENRLHELAEKKSSQPRSGEWFKISQKVAKKLIQKVGKEFWTNYQSIYSDRLEVIIRNPSVFFWEYNGLYPIAWVVTMASNWKNILLMDL